MKITQISSIIILMSGICLLCGCKEKDMSMIMNEPHNIRGVISYQRDFPDDNDTQLSAARTIGVKPSSEAD